jgi:UDP-glucose 4-epimerase
MPAPLTRPSKLLVTGGRGRLAALIADHFRAPQHQVSLFSREAGPDLLSLGELLETSILSKSDTILHLAWSSLPATSEKNPGIEAIYDLPYIERLLSSILAIPANIRPHLIFFSSGGSVYGNAGDRASRESDTCNPIGAYGRAKLAAEQLISERASQYGLSYTNLRISNPYGYSVPKNRAQGLIPHALRCAAENEALTLWGDGSAQKDFIYYTDFITGLEQVIDQKLTGTVNLCSGESHSVNQIIDLVERHTGKKITLLRQTAPIWDVQNSRLDRNHLTTATGWRPQVSLNEGIRRSAVSYATH